MTVNYCKDVPNVGHVDVDGDGITSVYYPNGSWGYDREDSIEFSIEELETILKHAKAHHYAYVAYRGADFEESVYNDLYDQLMKEE